jgi:hypothetical protein
MHQISKAVARPGAHEHTSEVVFVSAYDHHRAGRNLAPMLEDKERGMQPVKPVTNGENK